MNLLPPSSMRTVRMRDRGVMCVLSVISIHSSSCQPVRLLISGDTRRNRVENPVYGGYYMIMRRA